MNEYNHTLIENKVALPGVRLITNKVFHDDRGYFMETYRHNEMEERDEMPLFVQENLSCSSCNVFRGMHLQQAPHAQDKLIRVAHGAVIDFVLDVQPDSSTFGMAMNFLLSAGDGHALFVPGRYAHGFLSLHDDTILLYKVSDYYHPEVECSFHYSAIAEILSHYIDPEDMIVSPKDLDGAMLLK